MGKRVWEIDLGPERVFGMSQINNAAVFQAVLSKEKSRTDRNGVGFSLVLFAVRGPQIEKGYSPSLSRHIRTEIRSIDEVGWYDENTIGVLLPSTGIKGGGNFARRVSGVIYPGFARPPIQVHSYPEHRPVQRKSAERGSDASEEGLLRSALLFENVFRHRVPVWKRVLDILGSVLGLMVISPFMLLLLAYIKIISPGPALFRQQRIGLGGKAFTFLKLRTMKHDNNQDLHQKHIVAVIRADKPLSKLDDKGDTRIFPGGRVLRRLCLDEVPQLINVLRGEMTLVGPRPCMAYEAEEFLRWHTHRFDVLPGLTGLWQVSGKNKLTFSQMIRLDIRYAEHMCLWQDIKIIIQTIPAILRMVFESLAARFPGQSDPYVRVDIGDPGAMADGLTR